MPKELVFTGPRKVEFREYEEKPLADSEIRVRTLQSGISSGTELAMYRGTAPHFFKGVKEGLFVADMPPVYAYPLMYGYEELSEVIEVGKDVTEFKVGDVVMANYGHRETGTIDARKPSKPLIGMGIVEVPPPRRLPRAIDPDLILIGTLGGVGYDALLTSGIRLGESAVIMGLGLVGLMLVQLCREAGVHPIIAVDLVDERLKLAQELGADHVFNPKQGDIALQIRALLTQEQGPQHVGADVVFDCTGSYKALQQAIRCAAPDYGKVMAVGFYQGDGKDLVLGEEFHHGLGATQIVSVAPNIHSRHFPAPGRQWDVERLGRTFFRLLSEGKIRVQGMVTHRFPFEEAAKAFELLDGHPEQCLKVVLTFGTGKPSEPARAAAAGASSTDDVLARLQEVSDELSAFSQDAVDYCTQMKEFMPQPTAEQIDQALAWLGTIAKGIEPYPQFTPVSTKAVPLIRAWFEAQKSPGVGGTTQPEILDLIAQCTEELEPLHEQSAQAMAVIRAGAEDATPEKLAAALEQLGIVLEGIRPWPQFTPLSSEFLPVVKEWFLKQSGAPAATAGAQAELSAAEVNDKIDACLAEVERFSDDAVDYFHQMKAFVVEPTTERIKQALAWLDEIARGMEAAVGMTPACTEHVPRIRQWFEAQRGRAPAPEAAPAAASAGGDLDATLEATVEDILLKAEECMQELKPYMDETARQILGDITTSLTQEGGADLNTALERAQTMLGGTEAHENYIPKSVNNFRFMVKWLKEQKGKGG